MLKAELHITYHRLETIINQVLQKQSELEAIVKELNSANNELKEIKDKDASSGEVQKIKAETNQQKKAEFTGKKEDIDQEIKSLVDEKEILEKQKKQHQKTIDDFEKEILKNLKNENVGLIVLAGYMRLLSADFIKSYKNKILNIHPALLPSFKGTHGIKDAFEYGVKVTGPTVHFVTADMDAGPIILQAPVVITEDDTEETLARVIHKEEHKIYPRAIQLFIEGRLKIEGRRVKIL